MAEAGGSALCHGSPCILRAMTALEAALPAAEWSPWDGRRLERGMDIQSARWRLLAPLAPDTARPCMDAAGCAVATYEEQKLGSRSVQRDGSPQPSRAEQTMC
ncbi:hypothetical protein CLCR_09324 [Cladophialophora carrionii]|uniref:Uncharacterized protein n=1 Tax=Cladophialophora carrionii TaxID=86049 RepID=A0A1C1CRC2_9EURO|nr:hypothetical protein CLCR_09324 [Cladophialophora carrionii]